MTCRGGGARERRRGEMVEGSWKVEERRYRWEAREEGSGIRGW